MTTFYNNPDEDNNTNAVAYIYWTLLAVSALSPVVIFFVVILRNSAILHMLRSPLRYRSYGLRQLERYGNPKYTLFYFLFYRHRPLIMDLFKVAVEFSFIAHFFDQGVTLRAPLITWCIFDALVLVFLYNLTDLKGRSASGQGVPFAFWIWMVYSIALGCPMGTASKIIWIFHDETDLLFHFVPMPYYFGSAVLVMIIIFYLIPSACLAKDSSVSQFTIRMYLILLFFLVGIVFGWLFLDVEYCQVPHKLTELQTWFSNEACPDGIIQLNTFSAAFLPISLLLVFFNIYLSYMTTSSGLLWRFLPEVVTIWSLSITFLTSMYNLDKGDSRILFASIMVLGLSGVVSLMCNMSLIYVVIYTVRYVIPLREQEIAQGRRSRHFTEDQKKKNRDMRETMLLNFLKSKGKISEPDLPNVKKKIKAKEDKKKTMTLGGTLFRQMWVQSRDQMSRCCICFEDYSGDKEQIILAIIKKCGHYFHYDCVWDWLEKRPTCPMCRGSVDLDETGVQVLSYFDIKHAIRVNRPADADGQSAISGVSGATSTGPQEETTRIDGGGDDGPPGGAIEPPASLQPIIATITQSNPGLGERGPLPPIPPATTSSQGQISNTSQSIDAVVDIHGGMEGPPQIARQMSEPLSVIAMPPEVSAEEGKRKRTTSESNTSERHGRPSGSVAHPNETKRPTQQKQGQGQESRSHRGHPHGDRPHYHTHGGVRRPPEAKATSYHWQQHQAPYHQSRQPTQTVTGHRRPSSTPHQAHHVTPPPDTPHASRGKRQSRRRCEICGRRYEGDPRDIVVGYIRGCGHFYHSFCLDGYVRKHETCPRCHYENKEARKRGGPPVHSERRVTPTDIFLVFLPDILRDTDADTESSLLTPTVAATRGRHNRGYAAEMSRF